MGMFDEIVCNYPLPGTPPTFIEPGHKFQTKDLDCVLGVYTIGASGTIGSPTNLTDTIRFYTNNWRGGAPTLDGYVWMTSRGEDAESVEYSATFIDGKLVDIREVERTCERALHIDWRGGSKERLSALLMESQGGAEVKA